LTSTAHLRGGPERAAVADIAHARNLAHLRDRLEAVVSDLRAGA
jgi:hypothetical protein